MIFYHRLVAKPAGECGVQKSWTWFCSSWGKDGLSVGRAHGFEPLSVGLGGLAVAGRACGSLMFPAGNLRASSFKVVMKGKAVLSAGSCSISRNEQGLGQKHQQDIAWLGTGSAKAAVGLGVHFCCEHTELLLLYTSNSIPPQAERSEMPGIHPMLQSQLSSVPSGSELKWRGSRREVFFAWSLVWFVSRLHWASCSLPLLLVMVSL